MKNTLNRTIRDLKSYLRQKDIKEPLSEDELKQNIKTNILKTPEEQFKFYSPIREYQRLIGTMPPVILKKNTIVGCMDCGYTKEFLIVRNFDRRTVFACRRCGGTVITNLDTETREKLTATYEKIFCEIVKEMFP